MKTSRVLSLTSIAAVTLGGCIINTGDTDGDTVGAPTVTAGTETGHGGTDGETDGLDGTEGLDETGEEDDEFERPDEAREIFSDEDLQRLIDVGAVVYPGSNPPDVSSVFDVAGGVVTYHDRSQIEGTPVCNQIWTLESTENPEMYVSSGEFYGNCSGSSEGSGVYISGSGNCFTLYGAGSGERDGCEFESAGITSGCLTDDGIEDMISATLFGSWTSLQDNACESLIASGQHSDEGEIAVSEYPFVERVGG
jgi:hypothetical protein